MQSPYINNILEQPDSLEATLDSIDRLRDLDQLFSQLNKGQIQRIILTGMGSSFHALHPLYLRLSQANIMAQMVETSELVHYFADLLQPSTLMIAVSQSGQSNEIVQLIKLCDGKVPFLGITNTPGSPLAEKSDPVIITQAGEEHSVSCKTYITSMVALSWVGDQLMRKTAEYPKLHEAPQAIAAYLERLESHVQWFMEQMRDINCLYLVGRGPSLSAVGTGSLIIKEAARFPTEGMSSAAFRHGPLEMTSPHSMLMVYEGNEKTAKLNCQLSNEVLKLKGKSILIHAGSDLLASSLPSVSDPTLPLVEILPAQMLSIALAKMKGTIPGEFRFGHKITIME